MKEVIKEIKEVQNYKRDPNDYKVYDGFKVTTDKQAIFVGISNQQDCCENWGYFITNDDTKDFIGTELLSIDIVDMALNKKKIKDIDVDEGEMMFVDLVTSNGVLQLTAYNSHNGYYGHEAIVESTQLTTSVDL